MVRYSLSKEIPFIKCLECGNSTDFEIVFNNSRLRVIYSNNKVPRIEEWTDTGVDVETICTECGSLDIEIDDSFFEE